MTQFDENQDSLDALLVQASDDEALRPDADFMARMVQDALLHQPVAQGVVAPWWRRALVSMGGWQTMGGLVTATCAGFWIGVNPPAAVPDVVDNLLSMAPIYAQSGENVALAGFGWDLEEG